MEMKVADVIVKCLEAEGIEYAFGITGYHYLSLFKALKGSSIKFISVKHENAASLSAVQYARIAQKPALILGTAGPGVTNLVTGICELYKSNLPGFVISPIVPTNVQGKNACQEDSGYGNSYSISGIMSHITKKTITCTNPHNIAAYVRDLFRYSLSGRKGPVHLLVPVNFFEQKVGYEPLSPAGYRDTDGRHFDPSAIGRIAGLIENSKTPLLFIGHRAWYPDISESISKISSSVGIPVICSACAKGLFDEHAPYFGGILDLYGHRSAEVLVKQSDCVIALGQDFGEFTVNKYEAGLFDDKLIQIDVDGYDIGRNYPVKSGTWGDLGAIVDFLCETLLARVTRPFYDKDSFKSFFEKENQSLSQEMNDESLPLKPQFVLNELSRLSPVNSFFIVDIGRIGAFTFRYFRARRNGYSLCLGNYTLGQAVAGSIGGKIAAPGRPVFIICGDGAFAMHGMEIATARQYGLPIIWLVFTDEYYGSVEWSQRLIYGELDFCTKLFVPDLSKFAQAFSIDYYRITDAPSLRESLANAVAACTTSAKSALIEIKSDNEEPLPVKPMLIKFIQDMCNLSDFKTTPYFMKTLNRMLREKV